MLCKFLDDATGSSDTWAYKVANITFSYALEIGPLDSETELIKYSKGFIVEEKYIEYVAVRAYYALREYLRSFLDKLSAKAQKEISEKCLEDFNAINRIYSK